VRASERIETDRLVMRRPVAADAEAIFARYSSDPEVTRFLSWPRHNVVEDSRAFIDFSDAEWETWPAGPYLIESRAGVLLGSTGLVLRHPNESRPGTFSQRMRGVTDMRRKRSTRS
jgi:ribosomal-protein-alanine N-acetyltransferase